MRPAPSIVWFRLDLRLADNPALHAAVRRGGPVLPVFVWAPEEEGEWAPGAASRWWLHQSLQSLNASLRQRRSRLVVRRGPSLAALRGLAKETGAGAVFWNRRYEPAVIARDAEVEAALRADGLLVESFNSALLSEPWEIRNASGKPFRVFTPFWKALLLKAGEAPVHRSPAVGALRPHPRWPRSLPLASLELEPKFRWAEGIRATWRPGEPGAMEQLDRFATEALFDYPEGRNRPDRVGTSRLSPHLHFGEIGPRQMWERCGRALAKRSGKSSCFTEARLHPDSIAVFRSELGWREFAHHLLYHFPHTTDHPLRPEFERFAWADDQRGLEAWRRGHTGYPLVDAGMRELWSTGWMHNRVRMVVASFLVKDLLLPWQSGARWFWDTLVDADLANNTLGWQWTAGCGADAAPYFRIFNPASQAETFDPEGDYIRRWLPALARLPAPWIHRPREAPLDVLKRAGVALGRTYPKPIVPHSIARMRALAAYQRLRK